MPPPGGLTPLMLAMFFLRLPMWPNEADAFLLRAQLVALLVTKRFGVFLAKNADLNTVEAGWVEAGRLKLLAHVPPAPQ